MTWQSGIPYLRNNHLHQLRVRSCQYPHENYNLRLSSLDSRSQFTSVVFDSRSLILVSRRRFTSVALDSRTILGSIHLCRSRFSPILGSIHLCCSSILSRFSFDSRLILVRFSFRFTSVVFDSRSSILRFSVRFTPVTFDSRFDLHLSHSILVLIHPCPLRFSFRFTSVIFDSRFDSLLSFTFLVSTHPCHFRFSFGSPTLCDVILYEGQPLFILSKHIVF